MSYRPRRRSLVASQRPDHRGFRPLAPNHPAPRLYSGKADANSEGTGASPSAFTSLQADSLLSYAIVIVMPALDVIFPILPSETAIIALGGATAGSAGPRIALLVACAALGAFLGDNLSYLIGRRHFSRCQMVRDAGLLAAAPRPGCLHRVARRRTVPAFRAG